MDQANWQQAKDILNSALDIDVDKRQEYLSAACRGDAALRQQVEALLSSYESDFMEAPIATSDREEDDCLPAGMMLGRYEIVRLLGSGGMGQVYLAKDNQLDRKVAIKVLNQKYESSEANLKRFIQEAKAASALNHPNILTIHEIGETERSHYIVSEFIDGKTLREIIGSVKPTMSEIVDISIQIAGALSAAHSARIIHRDIKPENIIVRDDGYVKVLDFGLAKLIPQQPSFVGLEEETVRQNQTAEGLILGTVSYMSPEQAIGKAVDARTDIFSLGIVIYEMAAGHNPFNADSISEKFANLINKDPLPMSVFVAGVPDELQRIVSKMLRKEPDERYQTMKELLRDLNQRRNLESSPVATPRISAAQTAQKTDILPLNDHTGKITSRARKRFLRPVTLAITAIFALIAASVAAWYLSRTTIPAQQQIKSLAVLPLKSLDSNENFLGLGIADTVIRKISQTGQVIVRPTSSVRRYLTEDTDAVEAAKELKTDAVLEGNVQRVDDRLRVSVNLLRTSDGASLWTDSFEMRSGDIFSIQDTVAQQVVSRLRLKLDMDQSARLNKRVTSNPVAYDYYLKGVYSYDQRTWGPTAKPQAVATAELFKNAIAADPDFALAHAQLANIYAWTSSQIAPEDVSWFDLAQREINRADALDPNLAETHIARMTLLTDSRSGYQWEAGIREDLAAQEIDPNVGHINLADAYYHIGLEEQAEREFNKALETDPTSQWIQTEYVLFLMNYARYDEMFAAEKKYFPDEVPISDYFIAKGELDEALKVVDQEIKESPDNPWEYGNKAIVLAKKGDLTGADASVREAINLLRPLELTHHHMTYKIACAYAVMGKKDEAMKWLRETAATGYPVYPVFARDAFLDSIRKDSEFIQFMTEMKALNDKYKNEFP